MENADNLIGKQFYWAIIPCIIGLIYLNPALKIKLYLSLSAGLLVHLIICTLQYNHIVVIAPEGIGGTHAADATGYFGHLTFGFIYSVWAGSLIVFSYNKKSLFKVILFAVALYAFAMVFLAQGRGGYLIAIGILILLAFKYCPANKHKILLFLSILGLGAAVFSLNQAPIENNLKTTISSVESFLDRDWKNADPRIKIWAASIELWKLNPLLGIGTSGYKQMFSELVNNDDYAYLKSTNTQYTTAHNEYLFSLVRWGPVGFLVVLVIFLSLFHISLSRKFKLDIFNSYLLSGTALALTINSFSDVTLSGYDTLIFSIIMISIALTKEPEKK